MKTHKHPQHEAGQALVEFALTVPILLLLILGIIDFGRTIFALSQIIDGSRQGVRYGIVTGLQAGERRYLDCDGIEAAARDVAGFVDLQDVTVEISYEGPDGNPLQYHDDPDTDIVGCPADLDNFDVRHGDVLNVTVSGELVPVTPVLLLITDAFTFEYTSSRTIVADGTANTSEWQTQPDRPSGFNVSVDCDLVDNNVDFTWDPIDPEPDRIEILDSVTGELVALPDPENAWCNNCATISIDGGSGMYYMVTISGTAPSEMMSPSSEDDSASCPEREDLGSIWGWTCYDTGGNGCGNNDDPITDVDLDLVFAGADGDFDTAGDNVVFSTRESGTDGEYSFSGLEAGWYRLSVDMSDPDLNGRTTLTEPATNPFEFQITVAGGIADEVEQDVGIDD